GFERAARTHAWLGEAGLYAESQVTDAAARAQAEGAAASRTELVSFVEMALEAEVPGSVTRHDDGTRILRLPRHWAHGLEDLPGFDPDTRTLRVAAAGGDSMAGEESVAILGRAHPLVRRAIERVRHLRVQSGGGWLDPRVSVVRAP